MDIINSQKIAGKLHKSSAIYFILLLVFGFKSGYGQVYIEKGPVGNLKGAEIMIHGPDLSQMAVPYSRIKGSPFWKDEWQFASLYSDENLVGILPVRINLVTNDIHFLKNDMELVASDENKITAVIFHPGMDTSLSTAAFMKDLGPYSADHKDINVILQVMNFGKYELLKHVNRQISSADSLFGTQKRYFFTDEISYYLKSDETIQKIKKLSEDNFFALIPGMTTVHRKWIKEKNIDFKKEAEVVRFLDYYNSQLGK